MIRQTEVCRDNLLKQWLANTGRSGIQGGPKKWVHYVWRLRSLHAYIFKMPEQISVIFGLLQCRYILNTSVDSKFIKFIIHVWAFWRCGHAKIWAFKRSGLTFLDHHICQAAMQTPLQQLEIESVRSHRTSGDDLAHIVLFTMIEQNKLIDWLWCSNGDRNANEIVSTHRVYAKPFTASGG